MSPFDSSRILIVNENPDFQGYVSMLLTGEGHRVVAADDPEEAVALLRDKPFDLIIMDVLMSDRDSAEFIATLRSIGCTTPVIGMASRSAGAHTAGPAADAGSQFAPVRAAPFDGGALVDCVNTVLDTVSARANAAAHRLLH